MKEATTQEQVIKRLLYLSLALVALVIASLMAVIVINYYQSKTRDSKIEGILRGQGTALTTNTNNTNAIKDNVKCLGTFLAQDNWEDLIITDFDKCSFINKRTGDSGTLTNAPPSTPNGENQNNARQNGANGGTPPASSSPREGINGEPEPQDRGFVECATDDPILPGISDPRRIVGCL